MFKNKKVIIFDMDGTLIDSVGMWNKTDETLIKKFTNKSIDEFFTENDIQKFKTDVSAEEILKLRWNIANEYIINEVDYKENAEILLERLKEKRYILALATTTTKDRLDIYRKKLKKADIDKIFTVILSKEDVEHKKPSPEIHNKIMKKLNVTPEECLVIEDALIGVQAAKNAGIEVVNMYDKYSDSDREEINKLSDYKVKNFKELMHILDRENRDVP